MTDLHHVKKRTVLAALFPEEARRYLAHTAEGRPLRDIAREAGCHPSTILRQVRKLEALRDDPLVDRGLAAQVEDKGDGDAAGDGLDAIVLAMRHLCEPRAMLLYREGVRQAVIVKAVGEGETTVLGNVEVEIAAALVLHNWVAPDGGSALKRYRVTEEGRSHLPKLVAASDARAARARETVFGLLSTPLSDRRSRDRSQPCGPGSESPLMALARRRGQDGKPFLSADLVAAGDRLQEDFAIAGFGEAELLGWERPETLQPFYAATQSISDRLKRDARTRTLDAIRDLGPGLSEVALRCCCLREGLEATEKSLGWSARSGKVVLRIALHRLNLFYARTRRNEPVLIG